MKISAALTATYIAGRILGLIALYWTNWYVASICLVLQLAVPPRFKLTKSVVGAILSVAATLGFWFFPYLHNLAHVIAICFGIWTLYVIYVGFPIVIAEMQEQRFKKTSESGLL